jgi:hypothetical protein
MAYFKECGRCFLKYIAGCPVHVSTQLKLRVSLDGHGLPTVLPLKLREQVRGGNPMAIRIAIFGLAVYKSVKTVGNIDLSSITLPQAPLSGSVLHEARLVSLLFARYLMTRFGAKLTLASMRPLEQLHNTTKAGPNGPALASAHIDAMYLRESPLWGPFTTVCEILRLDEILESATKLSSGMLELFSIVRLTTPFFGQTSPEPPATYLPPQRKDLGRSQKFIAGLWRNFRSAAWMFRRWNEFGGYSLYYFLPKGFAPLGIHRHSGLSMLSKLSPKWGEAGKPNVRLFGIGDYFSQAALKGMHLSIGSLLKKIPMDGTFSHHGQVDRVSAFPRYRTDSVDLSSATDRFPIVIQAIVLGSLIRGRRSEVRKFVAAWAALLGHRLWRTPESALTGTAQSRTELRKVLDREITYGSGQPMGIYSSWVVFALSHHFIVFWARVRACWELVPEKRFIPYENYGLTGDDEVSAINSTLDERTLQNYHELMAMLGCPINPDKGVVSDNGTLEFCKRVIWKGSQVVDLHWKELLAVRSVRSYVSYLNLWKERRIPLPSLELAVTACLALVPVVTLRVWSHVLSGSPLGFNNLQEDEQQTMARIHRPLRDVMILLTSPVGPYKVPYSGWLALFKARVPDFLKWVNQIKTGLVSPLEAAPWDQGVADRLAWYLDIKSVRVETFRRAVLTRMASEPYEPHFYKSLSKFVNRVFFPEWESYCPGGPAARLISQVKANPYTSGLVHNFLACHPYVKVARRRIIDLRAHLNFSRFGDPESFPLAFSDPNWTLSTGLERLKGVVASPLAGFIKSAPLHKARVDLGFALGIPNFGSISGIPKEWMDPDWVLNSKPDSAGNFPIPTKLGSLRDGFLLSMAWKAPFAVLNKQIPRVTSMFGGPSKLTEEQLSLIPSGTGQGDETSRSVHGTWLTKYNTVFSDRARDISMLDASTGKPFKAGRLFDPESLFRSPLVDFLPGVETPAVKLTDLRKEDWFVTTSVALKVWQQNFNKQEERYPLPSTVFVETDPLILSQELFGKMVAEETTQTEG